MEGQQIAVWVYTNLDRVELFHNGHSLGVKEVPRNSHVSWNVTYAPGGIEARGYKGGRHVMTARRDTTGEPAQLAVRADRREIAADGEDVVMVAVEVQDSAGRMAPVADNEITFRVTGAGKLKGVGNGDPTSHESDIGSTRKAFSGSCMAIVQSTKTAGMISIEATAPGLTAAAVTIAAKPARQRPQTPTWERPIPPYVPQSARLPTAVTHRFRQWTSTGWRCRP